jgi:phospholipase/carboxylesterase
MMHGVLHLGASPAQARALCVFVHGRGQTPEDMADGVIRHLPQDVAYALPRAEGKSWYAARAIDPLTAVTRAEVGVSLMQLAGVIAGLRDITPGRPLLLAGFSQGACLSVEHAFSGRDAPDALAALTGCRVGVAADMRAQALPPGLPVYLSGADADPWIPVAAFADAVAAFGAHGAALRCDLFPGRAHSVSPTEIAMMSGMLQDLSHGARPRMEGPR